MTTESQEVPTVQSVYIPAGREGDRALLVLHLKGGAYNLKFGFDTYQSWEGNYFSNECSTESADTKGVEARKAHQRLNHQMLQLLYSSDPEIAHAMRVTLAEVESNAHAGENGYSEEYFDVRGFERKEHGITFVDTRDTANRVFMGFTEFSVSGYRRLPDGLLACAQPTNPEFRRADPGAECITLPRLDMNRIAADLPGANEGSSSRKIEGVQHIAKYLNGTTVLQRTVNAHPKGQW